jgi:hypothetical protein
LGAGFGRVQLAHAPIRKGRGTLRAPNYKLADHKNVHYFTVNVTDSECVVPAAPPSFAISMMLGYVPGMVAALSASWADPDWFGFDWEVAVMVTLIGRPAATVGAVYTPFASIVPPFAVVTNQFTT